MFKVNSKNTRTTSLTFLLFISNFEYISHFFSGVFIVNFEQVNVIRKQKIWGDWLLEDFLAKIQESLRMLFRRSYFRKTSYCCKNSQIWKISWKLQEQPVLDPPRMFAARSLLLPGYFFPVTHTLILWITNIKKQHSKKY